MFCSPSASGSVVEYRLAKARVAGSNPVSRSDPGTVWYRVFCFCGRAERNSRVTGRLRRMYNRNTPDHKEADSCAFHLL